MLLSILKAISEGLTAGFGILGLLTEFKDEKTKSITRNGKIALVGILASFIVSGIITVVENRDALAEHVEHAKEVERLSRRLGQLSLALDFKLKTGKDGGFNDLLKWARKRSLAHRATTDKDFPPAWESRLPSNGILASGIYIELYRSGFSCPRIADVGRRPDLILSTMRHESTWDYDDVQDNFFLTRTSDLSIRKDLGITSVEDFPGATLIVWSDAFEEPAADFETLTLVVADGVTYTMAKYSSQQVRDVVNNLGYCFTVPTER